MAWRSTARRGNIIIKRNNISARFGSAMFGMFRYGVAGSGVAWHDLARFSRIRRRLE